MSRMILLEAEYKNQQEKLLNHFCDFVQMLFILYQRIDSKVLIKDIEPQLNDGIKNYIVDSEVKKLEFIHEKKLPLQRSFDFVRNFKIEWKVNRVKKENIEKISKTISELKIPADFVNISIFEKDLFQRDIKEIIVEKYSELIQDEELFAIAKKTFSLEDVDVDVDVDVDPDSTFVAMGRKSIVPDKIIRK